MQRQLRSVCWFVPLLLCALLKCSLQDTLSCGTTNFQVTFEPSRPMLGAGAGVGVNANNIKYTFKPMDQLIPSNMAICNISSTAIQQIGNPGEPPSPALSGVTDRMVITKCDNCSLCPQQLQSIYRSLSSLAAKIGLQSLLVIVSREFETIKISDNTMTTKFVYMEEDPQSLTSCEITDTADNDALKSFSKTSVLFVSISFIILMVISLAWLVFYYVQRFRYAHAKDRLQRRLFNAAKKALTRIPTRPVKAGDKELDSDCPVCIDPYRTGDIVRMLPCRHIFHKSCVDPWLLEHRTCPMCKSDILKAFGYHVSVNSRRRTQFSAHMDDEEDRRDSVRGHRRRNDADRLSVDATSTTSESNAFPFPVVSEIHDPFNFSPATSPQLVQVMHATNARGFSIIPLTVHSSSGYASPPLVNTSGSFPSTSTASIEHHHSNAAGILSSHQQTQGNIQGAKRLLRAMTSGARRPQHGGHVVNLVHVRSRSLSNAQPLTSNNAALNPTSYDFIQDVDTSGIAEDRRSALFRSSNHPGTILSQRPITSDEIEEHQNEESGELVDVELGHTDHKKETTDRRKGFAKSAPLRHSSLRSSISTTPQRRGQFVRKQSGKVTPNSGMRPEKKPTTAGPSRRQSFSVSKFQEEPKPHSHRAVTAPAPQEDEKPHLPRAVTAPEPQAKISDAAQNQSRKMPQSPSVESL